MSISYEMATSRGAFTQAIPVKAGEVIPAGSLFGVTATGLAVPGDDATALRIAGRATAEADNSAVGAADDNGSGTLTNPAYLVDPAGAAAPIT